MQNNRLEYERYNSYGVVRAPTEKHYYLLNYPAQSA